MPASAPKPAPEPITPSRPRRRKLIALGVLALLGSAVLPAQTSGAATDPGLGTASPFAVLGSGTVTNTGPTVVNGDLGVHPGDAVVGFDGGPGIVNGTIHAGNATAADAQSAATIAYDALAAQACDEDLTGKDLGGLTLTAGVYCFSSAAQLTGPLTLDAAGDPGAVFVIRTGTTLVTASDSSVQFTDDLASCNVFWQVGSAATLGTRTDFVGTVIAGTEAITANTGATVVGRLLALNAAVTLDSNVITAPTCAAVPPDQETPVDETPVDETPVDETPVDETPVDETPVDEAPVDEAPVEEAPEDGTPVEHPPIDAVAPDAVAPDPAVPVDTTGRAPGAGLPTTPQQVTGGPATPAGPAGPAAPPTLPATGSEIGYAASGLLAILVGAGLVLASRPTLRGTARRPPRLSSP